MMKILAAITALLASAAALAADPPANLRHTTTVDAIEKAKNAIVYISTTKLVAQRINPTGRRDPFWEEFGPVRIAPRDMLGSGFIIHPDGYVVTNNHVIDRARQISVQLLDGEKYEAELISADSEADLAILRIRADKPLPTVELGDSSDLMIGEPVIAVGNPRGYSHSVSTGIVSAIHRDLKAADDTVILSDLVQTDAAINPGNSGGPLLNAYGQVIGINTAIRGDAQNIGFAIQVNRLRELIPDLMNPAQVKKLVMPVKLAESRRLVPPASVEATVVRADDRVTVVSIAGQKPRDIVDAYAILLRQQADQPFEVELDGRAAMRVNPKAAPLPDAIVKAKSRLGIVVEPVTPMLAQKYGLASEDGMLVQEVLRQGPAARAGIQPGDVLLQLDRFRISTLADFAVLLEHLPETGRVRVGIRRGDRVGFGALEL